MTVNVKGTSQSQWSTFILELNIMKKAWKRYGVDAKLKSPNINKIISQGTNNDVEKKKKRKSNHITNVFG